MRSVRWLHLLEELQMNRVFFQTELPIILANPNVTSIDGIPIAAFEGMTVKKHFRLLQLHQRSDRQELGLPWMKQACLN